VGISRVKVYSYIFLRGLRLQTQIIRVVKLLMVAFSFAKGAPISEKAEVTLIDNEKNC
jgi:hypothetical protein